MRSTALPRREARLRHDAKHNFTIRAEMDQVQADVAAGVEMISAADNALRLYYGGHFGYTIQIHSVGLKGSVAF